MFRNNQPATKKGNKRKMNRNDEKEWYKRKKWNYEVEDDEKNKSRMLRL